MLGVKTKLLQPSIAVHRKKPLNIIDSDNNVFEEDIDVVFNDLYLL